MSKRRYEIGYSIEFASPRFFCGSGLGNTSVDRVFLRSPKGDAILPGTQIKGLVRQRCEDLLFTLGEDFPDVHKGRGREEDPSLIARIFGRPGPQDLTCVFRDVLVPREVLTAQVQKRIRMNRRLGRPEAQALFDTEYAYNLAKARFSSVVTLWVDKSVEKVPPEVSLLCAGLRLVDGLGGDRSTGAGSVRFQVNEVKDEKEELPLKEVLAPLGEEGWPQSRAGGAP